jgi:hypothetical protein
MDTQTDTFEQNEEEQATPDDSRTFAMMRFGKISEMDRSFDIEYWLRQDMAARIRAVIEMAQFAYRIKGGKADELRLQRTVEYFQRAGS